MTDYRKSSRLRQFIVRFNIGPIPFKVAIKAESRDEADKKFVEQWKLIPTSVIEDDK